MYITLQYVEALLYPIDIATGSLVFLTLKHRIKLGVLVLQKHVEMVNCLRYFIHTTSVAPVGPTIKRHCLRPCVERFKHCTQAHQLVQ